MAERSQGGRSQAGRSQGGPVAPGGIRATAVETFLSREHGGLLLDPLSAADAPAPAPGRYPRVAVSYADVAALRAATPTPGVRAPVVAISVRVMRGVLAPVPRPDWPALLEVRSRRVGEGCFTVLRFARPVEVAEVVAEVGRTALWRDRSRASRSGLVVAGLDREPPAALERVVVQVAEQPGPLAMGPLDERVVNPIGFLVEAAGPVVDLDSLDTRRGIDAAVIESLRRTAGVRVGRWDDGDGVEGEGGVDHRSLTARSVAALALAGVPVLASTVPERVRERWLGADVARALTAPVDLDDPLAREEHSLVLRRAAFDTWAGPTWRAAVAARHGAPAPAHPAVSILLATRRPEQLDFALTQVARQRGVDRLELVLAPHGFGVDVARVREQLARGGAGGSAVNLSVVEASAQTPFGDVLHDAAGAAGGEVVLKFDDDDWYAPDVVADLLRARAYSGAELVGMPADRQYLTGRDLTVRRGIPTETYARFVAGGTMLIDRATLRAVGGFRSVRKYVDAQLIEAVLALGAEIYRTHGLGYLLRRNPTGHTWQVDEDYLLDPARTAATYAGFRPGRLMELD